MSQVGFLTHLVPLIAGRAAAGAAVDPGLAVAVNAVMALVGRVVLGFVIDRLEPRRASALCFLVQVAAIAVLARAEAPLVVYGACAVYGFSVGNNITLSPLIVQREYAASHSPPSSRCRRPWCRSSTPSVRACSASCATPSAAMACRWPSAWR